MRILITGGLGQLGQALQRELTEHELFIVDLPDLDITNRQALESRVREVNAGLVIHCAALTDVEQCARNPELAYRVNAYGTQNVAIVCQALDLDLIHISTNEVFAGEITTGYEEWMPLSPINPYGRSKAAAEVFVRSLLSRYYIVRTAWLYAPGGQNFIHAIIKNARTKGYLAVVSDEIGNPTYVKDLAQAISKLVHTGQYGVYHFTNHGVCSRWAFASEILRLAGLDHVINRSLLSQNYQRASNPPPYGALSNISGAALGITLRSWQDALADYISEYA